MKYNKLLISELSFLYFKYKNLEALQELELRFDKKINLDEFLKKEKKVFNYKNGDIKNYLFNYNISYSDYLKIFYTYYFNKNNKLSLSENIMLNNDIYKNIILAEYIAINNRLNNYEKNKNEINDGVLLYRLEENLKEYLKTFSETMGNEATLLTIANYVNFKNLKNYLESTGIYNENLLEKELEISSEIINTETLQLNLISFKIFKSLKTFDYERPNLKLILK